MIIISTYLYIKEGEYIRRNLSNRKNIKKVNGGKFYEDKMVWAIMLYDNFSKWN